MPGGRVVDVLILASSTVPIWREYKAAGTRHPQEQSTWRSLAFYSAKGPCQKIAAYYKQTASRRVVRI
jgi:hypothetical protein